MSEWRRGYRVTDESERKYTSEQHSNNRRNEGNNYERRQELSENSTRNSECNRGRNFKDDRVCYAYQRGDCRRGSDCYYSHQKSSRGPKHGSEKVCYAHQRGECRRGDDCRYSHNSVSVESRGAVSDRNDDKVVIENKSEHENENSASFECPQHLFRSRNKLFNGIDASQRNEIAMDTVASFSVTESNAADKMSMIILESVEKANYPKGIIFDGMACVGGNTISFSKYFDAVLSNEYDKSRFGMLRHNVLDVMNIQNVTFLTGSIIELGMTEQYDVLFLDPEWGGPDYKYKKHLRLTISDVPVEDFCVQVFQECPRVHTIALKLPFNYDNTYVQDVAVSKGVTYSLFTDFHRMTLTILQRQS